MNGELQNWLNNLESWSTIIRNFGLLIAAGIALWVAYRRIQVADRQAGTAQLGLLNERYQKGAEMLGSEALPVRLGGIYALRLLAEEHLEEYHIQTMRLFCAFVRHPNGKAVEASEMIDGGSLTPDADYTDGWEEGGEEAGTSHPQRVREDVQAIIDIMRKRSEKSIALERKAKFVLDLRAANLRYASLADMNLTHAFLLKTNLSNARLNSTILSGAVFYKADLSAANLTSTDLSGAQFSNPDNASRTAAIGLTQVQLDNARADPEKPPNLEGLMDAKTGNSLVWHSVSPSG